MITKGYIEERLDEYRIELSSRGVRFNEIKKKVAEYKELYFSKKNIERANDILTADIVSYNPENPLKKQYQPNILERRFIKHNKS